MRVIAICCLCALAACSEDRATSPEAPTTGGSGGDPEATGGTSGNDSGGGGGESGAGTQVGSGGASGAGGSNGGASGAGAGGVGGAEPQDPPPAELDLTGLIETSGSHVVFKHSPSVQSMASQLYALDLESGELIEVSEGDVDLVYSDVSPDLQTLLFSSSNAARPSNLFMLRSVENGVVPVQPVTGFTDRPANYYLMGWVGDGRFAVYSRGSQLIPRGIDVVDTWLNTLHGSIDGEAHYNYALARVAPAGLWFSFAIGNDADRNETNDGLARVVSTGIDIETPDQYLGGAVFSLDATRVVYLAGMPGTAGVFYRDLPADEAVAVTAEPFDGLELTTVSEFSIDRDHVLAMYTDGVDVAVQRRVDLRSGESSALFEDGHDIAHAVPFAGGTETLIVYEDGPQYSVALGDPTGQRAFEPIDTFARGDSDSAPAFFGALGPRHAFYARPSVGLTLIARDETGTVQRATFDVPLVSGFSCDDLGHWLVPANRGAFYGNNGAHIVVIDYSEPLARAATFEPQHGGLLSCPVWHPSGEGFAVSEIRSEGQAPHSWIYVVRWPAAGEPSALELVHEADAQLEVLLARP